MAAGRQRLYLHIGLPKTGSTYLQAVLASNESGLRAQGYCYPLTGREAMFHAAVEMASRPERWGLPERRVKGAFDAVLAQGRESGGHVVLSHETFGNATDEQVASIFERLAGFEVHVVLTVRDSARLLVAQWQERVKNGHSQSFADFMDKHVPLGALSSEPDEAAYDAVIGAALKDRVRERIERWGAHVGKERVHVVVVPASGAPQTLLWDRFAEAIGLEPGVIDPQPPEEAGGRSNPALGVPQVVFLRRVLDTLGERLPQPGYSYVVKWWFAQVVLAGMDGDRPSLPDHYAAAMAWVSQRWIDDIAASGVTVHGDLADLQSLPAGSRRHPDEVTDDELARIGVAATAEALLRVEQLRTERVELRREVRRLRKELRTEREKTRAAPAGLAARVRRRLKRAGRGG